MKKLLTIAIISVCILLQTIETFAWTDKRVEKEKKEHKQYTVPDGGKLFIDNTYGKVHINTWDKNEITIDITVTAKAKNDEQAQEILDRISFSASGEEGGRNVFCKTVLATQKHNIEQSSMQIDYVINAPKKNALDIINKYGDVFLADFSGKLNMHVSYGGLDMQTITGGDKNIKVAYGSAMVSSIESGSFDISYTNLTIESAGKIDVTNKFGNSNITSVQNLSIDQKYGNVETGTVGHITGTIDYANLEIAELQTSANLALKYCGKADFKLIRQGVDQFVTEAYYSNVSLHLADAANLSMEIATSYSSVKKSATLKAVELTNITPNSMNSEHYRGKAGAGAGNMVINAHYSNINFK